MSFLDDSTNIYNHETKTAESVTLAVRIETDEQDSFPVSVASNFRGLYKTKRKVIKKKIV